MDDHSLSDRLEPLVELPSGHGPYASLRGETADWLRQEPDSATEFAEQLLEMEPLLERSYLLGQPNLAGMGVAPWDLAISEPQALINPERGLRKMLGDEPEIEEEVEEPDLSSLERGVDLLQALESLDAAAEALPLETPAPVMERLSALRRDLTERLEREQTHSPELERLLTERVLPEPRALQGKPEPKLKLPSPQGHPAPEPQVLALKPAQRSQPGLSPELARLATQIARLTGRSLQEILKGAQLKKRAALGGGSSGPPVRIETVQLSGEADVRTRQILHAALKQLPKILEERLDPEGAEALRKGGSGRLRLSLEIPPGSPESSAQTLAQRLAQRIIGAGLHCITALDLGLGASQPESKELMDHLMGGDPNELARRLRGERKPLEGSVKDRLERFFGRDLREVMIFAGPMSGALARGLSAEAIASGKMIFFDPQFFQSDSPKSEALFAHELTHTFQEAGGSVRMKEAEALQAEASYLDWLQPGGAPFAANPLEPESPSAAAAESIMAGVMRAEKGREAPKDNNEGPRSETADFEERVRQVLSRVERLLEEDADFEHARFAHLEKSFSGPI